MMLKRKDKLLQKELESTDVGPSSTETAPAKNWVQDTPLWRVGTAIAIALGVYHFATSFVGIPQAWLHRAIHMMLVLLLAYISFGKVKKPIRYLEKGITVGFLCLAFVYILVYYNDIQLRAAFPTTLDLVIGTGLVALVIVACWRYVGPAMAWVIIAFCLYAVLGFLLPGRLKAPQLTFPYMISYLFNSNFALMGSTTGVAATSVVMFVFFGALLDKSGAMKVFSDISIMATRRITGGPAKASVIACALVGMIQGNSITNVATTGTFAIPLMKRAGDQNLCAGQHCQCQRLGSAHYEYGRMYYSGHGTPRDGILRSGRHDAEQRFDRLRVGADPCAYVPAVLCHHVRHHPSRRAGLLCRSRDCRRIAQQGGLAGLGAGAAVVPSPICVYF